MAIANENNPFNWPKQALLRFFHILSNHKERQLRVHFPELFLVSLRFKMLNVSSNEVIVSPAYIHPDDLERFRESRKTVGTTRHKLESFRTNYDFEIFNLRKMIQHYWPKALKEDLEYLEEVPQRKSKSKSGKKFRRRN